MIHGIVVVVLLVTLFMSMNCHPTHAYQVSGNSNQYLVDAINQDGKPISLNHSSTFPTKEPKSERFSYAQNGNLTQWQYQVVLPPFNVSEYKTWEKSIDAILHNYAAFNATFGELKINDHYSSVGNMSYWHFPKTTHLFGARQSLTKATYIYYGRGAGTSHLVTKFRSLPTFGSGHTFNGTVQNLFQKNDNEIHCRYYDTSRSCEVLGLADETFHIATAGDLEKWYGPGYVDYLGVPPNMTLESKKARIVVSTNWDMVFHVENSDGNRTPVEAIATLTQELEPEDPSKPNTNELDIKLNRKDAHNDPLVLNGALQALKQLSQFLVETELGVASCRCVMPSGLLGCVTEEEEAHITQT